MTLLTPWHLGASLYVPATRPDLIEVGNGKFAGLGSVIFCTEDAVKITELFSALENLSLTLPRLEEKRLLRFVRVRNPEVMREVLSMDLTHVTGLVLPKVHAGNLESYMALLRGAPEHLKVMPTLETREALSEREMEKLCDVLLREHWQERILSLRVGGNDLLNILGVRRSAGHTLYEGPLERVLSMLLSVFKPSGFSLSSPVYEIFSDPETLVRELTQDLDYGLCGKTIIHPSQIDPVLQAYRVTEAEVEEARAILAPDAPAVFALHGRMCEPATHSRWAREILTRLELYGVHSRLQ